MEVAIAIGWPWRRLVNPRPGNKLDSNKAVARPARFKALNAACFGKPVGDGSVVSDAG